VRLLLWDVDGTLVTARGAGRRALGQALREVYGTAGALETYDFRGKTDLRIVLDLLGGAGVPEAAVRARLDACFEVYVRALDHITDGGRHVDVLPGVADVIAALAARPDTLVGLLTGNIEPGARVKLAATGLWPAFRVGAFGSDDVDRRRLPAIAAARARALLGREFPFERITIIGDTPLDVDCARCCGATAVAVATGFHPAAELAACAPDLLFDDFADVLGAVEALTRA
jgi:phosphoglycolate phosphatase-like HAD superfamily hydrolase